METSPVPIKTKRKNGEPKKIMMSFPDALRHVIDGKRITKEEWDDPRIYFVLRAEYLLIHKADGSEDSIILRDGDLLGEDWYVLEDQ